ncbi:MAG TPA: PIN domain-containing protein [Actinomycetota bacterium]|nr:PIN domain-containing protein [Actinomycetota bacterium]
MGIALLDSSIVIGALNRDDAIHEAASRAVRAERERHALAISALTYAEILVGPLRAGGRAVEVVERFAAQTRIVDLAPDIARLAAELRAARGLKLPDAVIVATGLRLGADVILTADAGWKGIERVTFVGW